MGRINIGRVILGGIVAGIVGDILGYLVDGVMLSPQWAAGMRALSRAEFSLSQNVAFNIIGLVYGILIVWLYAELRPRYGAGPKTAVVRRTRGLGCGSPAAQRRVDVGGRPLPNEPYRDDDRSSHHRISSRSTGWRSLV